MKALKSIISVACAVCLAGVLPTLAANTTVPIKDQDCYIFVEGIPVSFPTEDGINMYPTVIYQDSTYMPLRTVGQWMGKEVSWDEATQTVTLSGSVPRSYPSTDDEGYLQAHSSVLNSGGTAQLRPDLNIVVDGTKQVFKNQKGQTIYPLTLLDITYLPLRSIGELTGYEVTWYSRTSPLDENGIFMRSPITDAQKAELTTYAYDLLAKLKDLDTPMQQLYTTAFTQVTTAEGVSTRLTKPEIAYKLIPQIKAKAEAILQMPAPQIKLSEHYYGQIKKELDYLVNNADTLIAALKNGAQPSIADTFVREYEPIDDMARYYTSAGTLQLNCEWILRMVRQDYFRMP